MNSENELKEQFIKLYNNPKIPVRKIRKKLDIDYRTFYELRKKLVDEGKVKPRKFCRPRNQPKPILNYSYCAGTQGFQIRKNNKYYANVKTEKQAIRLVELLKENDWDYNLRNELKQQAIKEFPR